MVNTPQGNAFGFIAVYTAMLNSFFNLLNPVLADIFYLLSITWLAVQIYHKLKKEK